MDAASHCTQLRNINDVCFCHYTLAVYLSREINFSQFPTLNAFATLQERQDGRVLLLVHQTGSQSNSNDIEEVILNVQGYLVDEQLPPVRQHQ